MTPGRESFAAGLAGGLSQSAAYRNAFPKSQLWKDATVWRKASLLAAVGEVQARAAELGQKAAAANEVTVERITAELARLAFFDVRRLVDDNGNPLPLCQLDDDTARAIIGLDVVRVGNALIGEGEVMKFKLADKRAALELLGQQIGMFAKNLRLTGPGGGPIQSVSMTPDEFRALAAEIAAKT